jgi:hypothetical protein
MIVAAKIALKLLEAAVMLCALWGIVPAYRRYGHAAGILLLLLFYYNIHAFLEGVPRYVCPVYPLVLLFAVIGFSDLWSRRKISAGVKAA